ncbi:MAG: hypothetical protein EF812_00930 [Methanosarcinales archaeon]|nr:MAG: hypothetical protein EF812_00930 [Methanosarcinales archaeon]
MSARTQVIFGKNDWNEEVYDGIIPKDAEGILKKDCQSKQHLILKISGHLEKRSSIKNTSKLRANTFGFYPINGRSVIVFVSVQKKRISDVS